MGIRKGVLAVVLAGMLTACGGGGGGGAGGGGAGVAPPPPPANPPPTTPPPASTLDTQLRALIAEHRLTGDPTARRTLPSINDPLAQLGKKLFFSKSLSGDFDTACASCHHPALGGSDGLSLSIGPGAVEPDLLGVGRSHPDGEMMARNAQTTFNVGLYDSGLFHDSRVESIGKVAGANGAGTGIRTPDTSLGVADPNAGPNLLAAQLRFPVIAADEMKGHLFMSGATGNAIRTRLAERLGGYGAGAGELGPNTWLQEFQAAFVSSSPAEQLITFDNIALAIAEYQRSQVFVNTPWRRYVEGDNNAISTTAKQGALMFFRPANQQGGAGCVQCHSGDFFTNEGHHTIGFPQIGPGKGDGATGDSDFGRQRETGLPADLHRFRTPSLLNVEVTGPYSHSGSIVSLRSAAEHYAVPDLVFSTFIGTGGMCGLPQFRNLADCATRFPNVTRNSMDAMAKMRQDRISDPAGAMQDIERTFPTEASFAPMISFLLTLTDPCVKSRECLAPWIPTPTEAPDAHQLNAYRQNGQPL